MFVDWGIHDYKRNVLQSLAMMMKAVDFGSEVLGTEKNLSSEMPDNQFKYCECLLSRLAFIRF